MKPKSKLAAEHDDATDGRKAHDVSTAPYATEEHMNEELTKKLTIEERAVDTSATRVSRHPTFVVAVIGGGEDVARSRDSALSAAIEAKALGAGGRDVVISDGDGREYTLKDFERLVLGTSSSEDHSVAPHQAPSSRKAEETP